MWLLYEFLFLIGLIAYIPKAILRRRLPHRGWSMRLGKYPKSVHDSLNGKSPIWVHAVSVGEVLSAAPLVHSLKQKSPVTLSTVTSSGFSMVQKQIEGSGAAIYVPLDIRFCVKRALNTIRPKMLLLMESELWPALISLTHSRGIPIAVVNGRISDRAFKRYKLVKSYVSRIVQKVDLFVMQTEEDANRIIALGASKNHVQVVGSMKWDAGMKSRPKPQELVELATRVGIDSEDRVIVAGSTHRGEEEVVLKAFAALRKLNPTLRLILAPRHLERIGEVEGLVRQAGFEPTRLSQTSSVEAWIVGIVDTLGQLSQYYGLAEIVFIGGSLIPHGGQNPLEAAVQGKPIIFGPSMHNFADIVRQLLAHQAAQQLKTSSELVGAIKELLNKTSSAREMGERAKVLSERSQGVVERTIQSLNTLLE